MGSSHSELKVALDRILSGGSDGCGARGVGRVCQTCCWGFRVQDFRILDKPAGMKPSGRIRPSVLEREVTLKTGQVVSVPVVCTEVAGANGVTWRKSCYNAVHNGMVGRTGRRKSPISCWKGQYGGPTWKRT